jgi:hypothetical protein
LFDSSINLMNQIKRMKNFQTIVVILVLLLIGSNSFACSCTGKSSVKEAVRNSDIVFGGKVLFVKRVDYLRWQGIPMVGKLVTLLVQEQAKGILHSDTVVIATGSGGADCGVQFQEGHSYLVYAKSTLPYYFSGTKTGQPDLWGSNHQKPVLPREATLRC